MVWNIFYFHPYLGKILVSTNIFQLGWNHQLVIDSSFDCTWYILVIDNPPQLSMIICPVCTCLAFLTLWVGALTRQSKHQWLRHLALVQSDVGQLKVFRHSELTHCKALWVDPIVASNLPHVVSMSCIWYLYDRINIYIILMYSSPAWKIRHNTPSMPVCPFDGLVKKPLILLLDKILVLKILAFVWIFNMPTDWPDFVYSQ